MEAICPDMGDARVIETRDDAYRLLEALGATARLLRHLALVGEAADDLIAEFSGRGLKFSRASACSSRSLTSDGSTSSPLVDSPVPGLCTLV